MPQMVITRRRRCRSLAQGRAGRAAARILGHEPHRPCRRGREQSPRRDGRPPGLGAVQAMMAPPAGVTARESHGAQPRDRLRREKDR